MVAGLAYGLWAARPLSLTWTAPLQLRYEACGAIQVLYAFAFAVAEWSGYSSVTGVARLEAFIRRYKRRGYWDSVIFSDIHDNCFNSSLTNSHHVLHPFTKYRTQPMYNFRQRRHTKTPFPRSVYKTIATSLFDCCTKILTKTYTRSHTDTDILLYFIMLFQNTIFTLLIVSDAQDITLLNE